VILEGQLALAFGPAQAAEVGRLDRMAP